MVLEHSWRRVPDARAPMKDSVGLLRLHAGGVRVVRVQEVGVYAIVSVVRVLERHLLQLTALAPFGGVHSSILLPQELD